MKQITFRVNGEEYSLLVNPHATLAKVLREELNLTGTKIGCEEGECGACTVLVNGVPMTSCIVPVMKVEGQDISTIEGVANGSELHPIQQKFIDHGAIQCGFCTAGIVVHSKAYLEGHPEATETDIRADVLTGHVCRCTGYQQMTDALMDVMGAPAGGGK